MSDQFRWTWVPNRSIGPFKFGEAVPKKLPNLSLRRLPDDETELESFEINNGLAELYVEAGKIEGAEVFSNLFLGSTNLIGKPGDEAMKIVGGDWEIEDDSEFGDRLLQNDELGIWLWEEDGVVDSITVSREDE